MTTDDALANQIIEDTRLAFRDFAHKRSTLEPTILAHMVGREAGLVPLLRPFGLLSVNNFRVRGKRFVFFSSRHAQLVARFGPHEATVIGGPADRRFAARAGLPFCFSGDLFVAAYNILFDHRFVPSRRVVQRWLRFFAQQQDRCHLVLPNDTLPVTTLLAMIARRCPNVVVSCVQHGLYDNVFDLDDIDGRNSHVNLVYDDSQRREMERRLPGALVEVMGLPGWHAAQREPDVPTAVMVGTGVFENPARYRQALDVFSAAAAALARAGIRVEYRPHPSEGTATDAASRFPLNRAGKDELLGDERKLFVGFSSTLLYEADAAGHGVFVLDDPLLPAYALADFGHRIVSADVGRLESLAPAVFRQAQRDNHPPAGVRERFEAALERALARLPVAPPVAINAGRRANP